MNGETQPEERSNRRGRGGGGGEPGNWMVPSTKDPQFSASRGTSSPGSQLLVQLCALSCACHPCQAWSLLSPPVGAGGAQDCVTSTPAGYPCHLLYSLPGGSPLPSLGLGSLARSADTAPDAVQITSVKIGRAPTPLGRSPFCVFLGFCVFGFCWLCLFSETGSL